MLLEWVLSSSACLALIVVVLGFTQKWGRPHSQSDSVSVPSTPSPSLSSIHPSWTPFPRSSRNGYLGSRPRPARSISSPTSPSSDASCAEKKPRRRRRASTKKSRQGEKPSHEFIEQDFMSKFQSKPYPRLAREEEFGNIEYKVSVRSLNGSNGSLRLPSRPLPLLTRLMCS